MIKHIKYILLSLILLIPTSVGAVKSKTFMNILALGNVIANQLTVNTNLTVGGNIDVAGGMAITGDLNMGGNNITNVNKITAVTTKTTNVESVNGNTVSWPTNVGHFGDFLGISSDGVSTWTSPGGGIYVSAPSPFAANNTIIRSTGVGTKNVKDSVVTLDDSGNMSGVGTLNVSGATTIGGDLNMTNHNVTGVNILTTGTAVIANLAATTMYGNLAMGGKNISGAGTITATTFVGALTGHASSDLALTGGTMSGNIGMGTYSISNVGNFQGSYENFAATSRALDFYAGKDVYIFGSGNTPGNYTIAIDNDSTGIPVGTIKYLVNFTNNIMTVVSNQIVNPPFGTITVYYGHGIRFVKMSGSYWCPLTY